MTDTRKTQNLIVLAYLQRGHSITQMEAAHKFNIWRLSARIFDLRCLGNDIVTTWESNNDKRWARYVLIKSAPVTKEKAA